LLKQNFSLICQIISATGVYFKEPSYPPKSPPKIWDQEFGRKKLVIKLEKTHLLIRPGFFSKIKIYLINSSSLWEKEGWLTKMKSCGTKNFLFDVSNDIPRDCLIFNLGTPGENFSGGAPEELLVQELKAKGYICPRCNAPIDEDPDDILNCPACEKLLTTISCPDCGKDIWADAKQCSECQKEFAMGNCPSCKKTLILTNDLNNCPFCQEDLYTCPRCHKYINQDPSDYEVDSCPLCGQTLRVIDCPACDREIPPDGTKCECGAEFKVGKCPYDDCKKNLILSKNIEECPYCDGAIILVKCPDCCGNFYIENHN
jgi:hypothetical protein